MLIKVTNTDKKCDANYYENKIHLINILTGSSGSKKSYYPDLKRKFSEIQSNNLQLRKTVFSLESLSQLIDKIPKGPQAILEKISEIIAKIFDVRYVIILTDNAVYGNAPPFSIFSSNHIKYFSIIPEKLQAILSYVKNSSEKYFVDKTSYAYYNTICFPIKKTGDFTGAICLKSYKNTKFSDADIHLLQILSSLFIISMDNAQLIQESAYLCKIAEKRKEEAELKAAELVKTKNQLTELQKNQILSEERNRIAAELHDNIAQTLLTIGLNLEWCLRNMQSGNAIYSRLKSIQVLSQTTIYQLRNTIFELSIDDKKSLLNLLYSISKEFENLSSVKTKILVSGKPKNYSVKYKKIIYLVYRECLYNIAKHAKATSATINIKFMEDETIISISDNGIGISEIDIKNAMLGTTLGLKTIFERIKAINGNMDIANLHPRGTKIIIKIPDEKQ